MYIIDIVQTGMVQGIILAIITIGVMIPFKISDFPDLTCEASYPFGAVLTTILIGNGVHYSFSLIIAAFLCGLVGACTALIHIKYKINSLLCGIIVSAMIYSINLRLMGKPNLSIFTSNTLFSSLSYNDSLMQIFLLLSILIPLIIVLWGFLNTEKGLQFRAAGANKYFAQKTGIDVNKQIIFGLFLGGAFCGIAGSLMAQLQLYADITLGTGIVIHALAAMMIGEKLIKHDSIIKILISSIVGAIIYQQIQGAALFVGLEPSDLKLMTSIMILMIISSSR